MRGSFMTIVVKDRCNNAGEVSRLDLTFLSSASV